MKKPIKTRKNMGKRKKKKKQKPLKELLLHIPIQIHLERKRAKIKNIQKT